MSRKHHWFVPDDPDVLGLLGRQIDATLQGLDALALWAGGDASAAAAVRAAEHAGDVAKQEVLSAVTESFVTPIEPEDLFALSQGIDLLLNRSRDLVNEAEAMGVDARRDDRARWRACSVSPCARSPRRSAG